MKIGTLMPDHFSGPDELVGEITTLEFQYKIRLIPAKSKFDNKAPDYQVVMELSGGRNIQVGGAWKAKSNYTNTEYISILIDDPSFSKELRVTAFKGDGDEWNISWRRQESRSKSVSKHFKASPINDENFSA